MSDHQQHITEHWFSRGLKHSRASKRKYKALFGRRDSSFDVCFRCFEYKKFQNASKSHQRRMKRGQGLMLGTGEEWGFAVCHFREETGWLNIQFDIRWVFNSPDTHPEWATAAPPSHGAPQPQRMLWLSRERIFKNFQRHSTRGRRASLIKRTLMWIKWDLNEMKYKLMCVADAVGFSCISISAAVTFTGFIWCLKLFHRVISFIFPEIHLIFICSTTQIQQTSFWHSCGCYSDTYQHTAVPEASLRRICFLPRSKNGPGMVWGTQQGLKFSL